jgi:hypothetical protein
VNIANFPTAATVTAWIRFDGTDSNHRYFFAYGVSSNADELLIGVLGSNRQIALTLKNRDLYSSSSGAVTTGVWAWISLGYSAGTVTLHVDGTQLSTVVSFGSSNPSGGLGAAGTIAIGQESDGSVSATGFSAFDNAAYWIGAIGQVCAWVLDRIAEVDTDFGCSQCIACICRAAMKGSSHGLCVLLVPKFRCRFSTSGR